MQFLSENRLNGCQIFGWFGFLSHVSTLTRYTDIAILSVRDIPVLDENGLTYCHNFSPYDSPIILVLPASHLHEITTGLAPARALNRGVV